FPHQLIDLLSTERHADRFAGSQAEDRETLGLLEVVHPDDVRKLHGNHAEDRRPQEPEAGEERFAIPGDRSRGHLAVDSRGDVFWVAEFRQLSNNAVAEWMLQRPGRTADV